MVGSEGSVMFVYKYLHKKEHSLEVCGGWVLICGGRMLEEDFGLAEDRVVEGGEGVPRAGRACRGLGQGALADDEEGLPRLYTSYTRGYIPPHANSNLTPT